jgi:hypothetical protein
MRTAMLLTFLLTLSLIATAVAQPVVDTLWTRTYGGPDNDYATWVQQTTDGGYIMCGYTKSFGAGHYDFWLLKTDADGDTLWSRAYGGSDRDEANYVEQTSDGGYIVAGYSLSFGSGDFDIYVVKTDDNGDAEWSRVYGTSADDHGFCVRETEDEGYVVCGCTGHIDISADVWLFKLDLDGEMVWSRTYSWPGAESANYVEQTTDGGYILAGWNAIPTSSRQALLLVKTDDEGDTLWTRHYGSEYLNTSRQLQQTPDGGYIVSGTYGVTTGTYDYYLLNIDANGDTLWTRRYGRTSWNVLRSFDQTSDGGYILGGYTDAGNNGDFYFVKTDANGDTLWTRTYGTAHYEQCFGVQQIEDDNYIAVGHTGTSPERDIWLMKLGNVTGVDPGELIPPMVTTLHQNYPNPFNATTDISFSLAEGSDVSLKVYDLTGRVVTTLVRGQMGRGEHVIGWDASEVSSGVYFYKLTAGDYSEAKRMMLIK